MLIRHRLLAALVAALPLTAAVPLRAQTCPCPQGDDAAYETALFPVTPASLPLCTADGCGTLAVQVTHRLVTPATTDGTPPPASPHYLGVEAGGNASFPEPAGAVVPLLEGGDEPAAQDHRERAGSVRNEQPLEAR